MTGWPSTCDAMNILFSVIAPVFCLIGFGYGAAWRGWISAAAIDQLMAFTQKFAIPCLLFYAIATLDLAAHFAPAVLVSFYTGAVAGFLCGLFGARFVFHRPWDHAVAVGFVGLFSNSVLLGLPVMERAYGPAALSGNYAIIAVHSPICYLVGITVMELVRAKTRSPMALAHKVIGAMFRNTLVIGLACGFAVNLSGLNPPFFVMEAAGLLASAGLPL
ncbi:MAG: AEC family transporter, partial [Pseudomonadota bacterium]